MRNLIALALLAVSSSGCMTYAELRAEGSRVWLISSNKREVWRCIDATPLDTPYRGGLKVWCKQATWYDEGHEPMIDASQPGPSTVTGTPTPTPR